MTPLIKAMLTENLLNEMENRLIDPSFLDCNLIKEQLLANKELTPTICTSIVDITKMIRERDGYVYGK